MLEKDFSGTAQANTQVYVLTSRLLQLTSWFAVFAAMIFAVMFFTLKTAHASSATCYDITGQSTQVLYSGVPNSGVMHFEDPAYVPALQYQACVEDTGPMPLGTGPFSVKGWAWDTNLGWISFYCGDENGDGAPYENLGIPCGNQLYGVKMEGLGGSAPGSLYGYAWGDNAGWINFSCSGGVDSLGGVCGGYDYGVTADTTDPACYGEIYGPTKPDPSCSNHLPADSFTFVWSDNVGWFNLEGVQLPWIDLIDAGVVVTAWLEPNPADPSFVSPDDYPVADGNETYKVRMQVTKPSGAPIVPTDYTYDIELTWPKNCIDLDQTNTVSDCSALPASVASSPTTTEASFNLTGAGTGGYGQDGVPNAFTLFIPSYAPTSNLNGYTSPTGGFFPYETFVVGDPNGGTPIPANALKIGQLSVSIKRTADSLCVFSDGFGTCNPGFVTDFTGSPDLGYRPAVDITTLDNQTTDANAIQAAYQIGQTISYQTDCRGIFAGSCGSATAAWAMGVATPEFRFVADFAGDNDGAATCNDGTSFAMPSPLAWSVGSTSSFIITPVFQPDGSDPSGCKQTGPDTGDGAYLYSTVSYTAGGNPVKYFSNKLPRVTGTLVVNPVASVKGSVYSTGVTNPNADAAAIRSIGDVSTNILRDTIFKNVSGIIAGAEDKSANDFSEIYSSSGGGFGMASTACVGLLQTDAYISSAHAIYCKGDVHIHGTPSGDPVTWTEQRTIISVGGDIYIDDDLYNNNALLPPGSQKPRLGIIALKDLNTNKGGNVYIQSDVTDIQANIFTDGSVFSYDNAANINSAGEPCWTDEKTRHNTLINQLYIEGSIASQNTIGGAADVTPTLGNGKKVSAAEGSYGGSGSACSPNGREQARLYDLNFLRYYGLVFERDPITGNAIDQNGDSVITAVQEPAGDLVLPSDLGTADQSQYLAGQPGGPYLSAVYVYFDPPPSSLPGFGVTSGVDMNIRI